jgi:SAM-dependent methyltransferase
VKLPFMENDMSYPCPLCSTSAITTDGTTLGGYQLFVCTRCTLRFAPEAFQVPVDYDGVYRGPEYQRDQVRALESLNGQEQAALSTYAAFFRNVHRSPGARLLDVGCGVGRFGHGAYARGWDVTGIDVSAEAIAAGQPFAPFPLRVNTIEELVEQGERFDVVTAFEVLEHLTGPVEFLSTVQRLLVPGGQVFCTVPNWDSHIVRNSARPDWLPPIHLLFFTSASLKVAAERSGLSRVTIGVIHDDPIPTRLRSQARWMVRRLLGRPREPLGLWVHGWVAP